MNLQRFVSTVYSERISTEYSNKLNGSGVQVQPKLDRLIMNLRFDQIRTSYTQDYVPYPIPANPTVQYLLNDVFFERVFGNTIGKIYKTHTNTIVVFPVFHDTDSRKRLIQENNVDLKTIYTPILNKKTNEEFKRDDSNHYMFIPVFSDETETTEEYTERLNKFFTRWLEFIQDQKPLPTDLRKREFSKFETLCYTVDHNNELFTDYYNTKLKSSHAKIANQLLTQFIEKLGMNNRNPVKDPILQLTPELIEKKFKSDGYSSIADRNKLEILIPIVKEFIDYYKKTNDAAYLKTASATENQTILRIYYRVNNTDYLDNFQEIQTGSTNVYKLTDSSGIRLGYFIEKKSVKKQYLFREYTGLSKQITTGQKDTDRYTEEELADLEYSTSHEKPKNLPHKDYIVETQLKGNTTYFKRVVKGQYKEQYTGTIEPFSNLHIYEKYKWFDFRDMDGSLVSDTQIRFYENILFDKKSLTDYLKWKKQWSKDTLLNKEFLKINQNSTSLMEYAEYITEYKKKTHVFTETWYGSTLEAFREKSKRSIIDLIFQTNSVLYLTEKHSNTDKPNTSNNYKMVSYQYYAPVKEHFDKVLYDMVEHKYCRRKKQNKERCELITELATPTSTEYGIVIVDITKENIEVDDDLKSKTYCKKVRKTLRKQMQPFLRAFLPQWKGGKLHGTRRKIRKTLRKTIRK